MIEEGGGMGWNTEVQPQILNLIFSNPCRPLATTPALALFAAVDRLMWLMYMSFHNPLFILPKSLKNVCLNIAKV